MALHPRYNRVKAIGAIASHQLWTIGVVALPHTSHKGTPVRVARARVPTGGLVGLALNSIIHAAAFANRSIHYHDKNPEFFAAKTSYQPTFRPNFPSTPHGGGVRGIALTRNRAPRGPYNGLFLGPYGGPVGVGCL